MRWRLCLATFLFCALAACGAGAEAAPTPATPQATPTLLGTANPPTPSLAPPTPKPPVCIFRVGASDEAGLYRFDWQNATITLQTKIGPLIVDGPRTLVPGPRQVLLIHDTHFDGTGSLNINFAPGGTLVDDPALGLQEVHDAGGGVVSEAMADPAGDTHGLPAYLDIVRVERTYGYYPNSQVRVYLAGIHTGAFIWNWQSVSVSVAGQTFTQQTFFDNHVVLSQTDSQGRVTGWDGPVTVDGNAVVFSLLAGPDQSVSAATANSGGPADSAGPYPQDHMRKYWQAAGQWCP